LDLQESIVALQENGNTMSSTTQNDETANPTSTKSGWGGDEDLEALAESYGKPPIENDNVSTTSSTYLKNLVHAEVTPSKTVVIVWALLVAELGFDLVTTAMAFWSTMGAVDCCGHTVYMGPLPMTTAVPFFFLIVAEITFLIRAILLTLWPSKYETARIEAHGDDNDDDEEDDKQDDIQKEIGFEVALTRTYSESTTSGGDSDSNFPDLDDIQKEDNNSNSKRSEEAAWEDLAASHGKQLALDESDGIKSQMVDLATGEVKTTSLRDVVKICNSGNQPRPSSSKSMQSKESNESERIDNSNYPEPRSDPNETTIATTSKDPEFIESPVKSKKKTGRHKSNTCGAALKRCFCGFLRWNARMVLAVLNLLTLANPFFGCVIAFILLYTSDKTESFVVLGIESLSIVLHFVSVRMEGGLRTWWSKCLHSIVFVPFLVTIVVVLLFLREGGVCYTVENQMFGFSGCEVCPDTLEPPINGMCGNSTLMGTGLFGDISISGLQDLKNLKNIAQRGAEQGSHCSAEANFCFLEF